eukprot:2876023-Rhodomonas_salina.1
MARLARLGEERSNNTDSSPWLDPQPTPPSPLRKGFQAFECRSPSESQTAMCLHAGGRHWPVPPVEREKEQSAAPSAPATL